MENKKIEFNGVEITCHSDGSITKPFYNRLKRTFGTLCKGYMVTYVGGKLSPVHRMIAKAFCKGYDESFDVDHIDGNKVLNESSNLRWLTRSQNCRAFNKDRLNCTSRHRNVSWQKDIGHWRVQLVIKGKKHHVGIYKSEDDAVIARDLYLSYHLNF